MSAYSIATRGLAGRKIPQGVLAPMNTLLFGSGEPGAWYDPADLSTLFQDTAGTTPVTAVEQAVALMLDKSGRGNHAIQATSTKRPRYSRRVNLLTKTDDYADTSIWQFYGAASLTAGIQDPFGGISAAQLDLPASGAGLKLIGPAQAIGGLRAPSIYIRADTPGTIRLVEGAYLAAWDATVSVTTNWQRFTPPPNATTGVSPVQFGVVRQNSGQLSKVYICSPQLETGSVVTKYQWVNTATDYDADPNKFPAYLACDGIDDAMQTGNIDFTGTDKMTVWAGITKLSDAAVGVVVELGTAIPPGGLYMAAPNSVGPTFGFASKGTVQASPTPLGHAAPKNAVLTGIGDISGDIASLRVNGVATTINTDQGTGNYGNLSLYIVSRAGTALFFNGRLYSLIVRGAKSSLSQIEAAELYTRRRMMLP